MFIAGGRVTGAGTEVRSLDARAGRTPDPPCRYGDTADVQRPANRGRRRPRDDDR